VIGNSVGLAIGVNSMNWIPLKKPSDFRFVKTFDHQIYPPTSRSLNLRQTSSQMFDQDCRREVYQRNQK